jgi:hypothetical protein
MSVSRREALFAGATLPVSAMLWKTAYSQAPAAQPASQPAATKQPVGQDALIGVCLLIDGRKQIETCTWAKDKLTKDDFKSFAKAVVEDKERCKARLKEFGLEYPTIPRQSQQTAATTSGVQQASAIRSIPAIAVGRIVFPPPASDFVLFAHEIAEKCIASFKTRMEKKQGDKLDRAFANRQMLEHEGELDRIEVFKTHASHDMLALLKDAHQDIEKRIHTLEDLHKKLEG